MASFNPAGAPHTAPSGVFFGARLASPQCRLPAAILKNRLKRCVVTLYFLPVILRIALPDGEALKKILLALIASSLVVAAGRRGGQAAAHRQAAQKPSQSQGAPAKPSSPSKAKPSRKRRAQAARAHRVRVARRPRRQISDDPTQLDVKSTSALVIEQGEGRTLYAKNIDAVEPIASITKLMTAMVVLDAKLDLREARRDHRRRRRHAQAHALAAARSARCSTRDELLRLALMASENRAAAALARAYPGGMPRVRRRDEPARPSSSA